MKAIVIHEFGPPDVLKYESVPDPDAPGGVATTTIANPKNLVNGTAM